MKLNVIGIKRIKGDKSKAGNPYDICSVFALVPIEVSSNEKMTVTGKGYEIAEVPYEPELFDTAKFQSLQLPQLLELQMDSRPRFGRFESICVGFEVITKPTQEATRKEYENVQQKS